MKQSALLPPSLSSSRCSRTRGLRDAEQLTITSSRLCGSVNVASSLVSMAPATVNSRGCLSASRESSSGLCVMVAEKSSFCSCVRGKSSATLLLLASEGEGLVVADLQSEGEGLVVEDLQAVCCWLSRESVAGSLQREWRTERRLRESWEWEDCSSCEWERDRVLLLLLLALMAVRSLGSQSWNC